MKLITVEATFGADNLDAAMDAISAQADSVRAMSGCHGYGLYTSNGAVAIVQKWDNLGNFDAYRQSDAFASLGAALKPLMSKPPVTTVASVDTV